MPSLVDITHKFNKYFVKDINRTKMWGQMKIFINYAGAFSAFQNGN
jgi:hypothetical protein